jgi:hypothetical protein
VLVTGWHTGRQAGADGLLAGQARRDADISAYRHAVADLHRELGRCQPAGPEAAERVLIRRLAEPEFAIVLSAVPSGPDAAVGRVLTEVRAYRPSARSSAGDLAGLIRIALLAQIDFLWWAHVPAYQTDVQLLTAADLVDLEALRRDGQLLFRYRLQASTLLGRAARSAERRAAPGFTPRTAGLKFPQARPELIVLLNQVAADFASMAPRGTPPMWVTSLARSVEHQRHLRALGYAAVLPSAHCVGYAADVEMTWFRRFHADRTLRGLLLERQAAGEINVIDEGQAWHLCLRPGAGRALRLIPEPRAGG